MEAKKQNIPTLTPETFKEAIKAFVTCTDNNEMHRIEKMLQNYTRQRESLFEIMKILNTENHPTPIKQMLTLLLKRSILKNYMKLGDQEKLALRHGLLALLTTVEKNRNIQTRLAESLSTICQCENIKLANWKELCDFITMTFTFENKENFVKSLILLTCLAEISPEVFDLKEICSICERIQVLFDGQFSEDLDEVYIAALKALFAFLNVLVNSDFDDSSALEALLTKLLSVLAALFRNQKIFHSRAHELQELIVSVFEDLTECLETNLEKFSRKSIETLLHFILDSDLLLSSDIDAAAKSSIIDLLGLIFIENTDIFRPKKSKNNFLQRIFQIYTQLLLVDEREFQTKIAENPESTVEIILEDSLSHLILISIESICRELRTKQAHQFVEEMIALFMSQGAARLVLRLYSATVEGLQTFYVKTLNTIYKERLLPALTCQKFDVILAALKTLSFFIEYSSPDILDNHESFLPILLGFLEQGKNAETDANSEKSRMIAVLVEHTLFALELAVENLEEDEISAFSSSIFTSVLGVLSNKLLTDATKKSAICCLGAIFSTAGSALLQQSMPTLLQILHASCANELLMGESLIAIAKLSLYTLQDSPQKESIYGSHFKEFFDKSLFIINSKDTAFDYETYEGAFTILYHAVKLFGRGSSFFVDANLFKRVINFLEDVNAEGDDVKEPLSERDSNEWQDADYDPESPSALARLPYFYMLCAGLYFIGEALRYLPDIVITNDDVNENIKNFLIYKVASENEDVRHQVILAASNYVTGVLEYLGHDLTPVFFSLLDVSLKNEESDTNISRNLEVTKDLIESVQKMKNGAAVINSQSFLNNLITVIRSYLIDLCQEEFNPDNYVAVTDVITAYIKSATTENAIAAIVGLYDSVLLPLKRKDDFDICVFEELYGFLAETIMFLPQTLDFILQHKNTAGEFEAFLLSCDQFDDEAVIRNGMFLIGVVAEHMRPPFISEPAKITNLIGYVQSCFGLCSLDVVKDNCVSACVKLYLNEAYRPLYGNLLDDEKILAAIKSRIPLKGDDQETGSLLKGLLYLAYSRGRAESIVTDSSLLVFILQAVLKRDVFELSSEVTGVAKKFLNDCQSRAELAQVVNSLDAPSKQALIAFLSN